MKSESRTAQTRKEPNEKTDGKSGLMRVGMLVLTFALVGAVFFTGMASAASLCVTYDCDGKTCKYCTDVPCCDEGECYDARDDAIDVTCKSIVSTDSVGDVHIDGYNMTIDSETGSEVISVNDTNITETEDGAIIDHNGREIARVVEKENCSSRSGNEASRVQKAANQAIGGTQTAAVDFGNASNPSDGEDGNIPPVESDSSDEREPDATDSVDDRLEEFKNPDSGDFESSSGDLGVPDDSTKDFDTTPGPSLGEDLDKRIGPNPTDGFDQRFENRPGDDVKQEENAGHDQNDADDENLPQKDFDTIPGSGLGEDLDKKIDPVPEDGFDQRFDNRPGDDTEQESSTDQKQNDNNYPQKDFRTEEDEMEWDTEIGPNPADGFDQRFRNRPGDDTDEERNVGSDQKGIKNENYPQKDFKTGESEPDLDTEIGPNPTDGFDQRFDNRPSEDIEEEQDSSPGKENDENLPQRDFDTTPGSSLGEDLNKRIGPNPADGYRQRFRNRPSRSR